MAKDRPKRVTAKLRLAERPDGIVQFEIVTSRRLENFHHRTWAGWDHERQEHIWKDEGLFTPDKYLLEPSTFGFMFSGPERDKWRYITVRASAPIDGVMQRLVERVLDLSDGSEERRLLALLVRQDGIPVAWVNEDVEAAHPLDENQRANFLIALETTSGVGAKEWKEEMDELAWQRSASWRPGLPRPRRYKAREATPPASPIPFFASRSGAIPRARGAEVAGVRLPAGRRYPRGLPAAYWASDEPVANVVELASELASGFPETGLWPLLWRWYEDPDAYLGGHGDLDAVDRLGVEDVMRRSWSHWSWPAGSTDPFTEFPRLAPPRTEKPIAPDPFQTADEAGAEEARLLLVPCNRPADAITMLGGVGAEVEGPVISAVLRSWEERFSATAYEVAPGIVKLAVAAPPTTEEHALLVAAEHMAFCPPDDGGTPGALRNVARGLLTSEAPTAESYGSSRERWYVGWYD
jgi:hypothetical protein